MKTLKNWTSITTAKSSKEIVSVGDKDFIVELLFRLECVRREQMHLSFSAAMFSSGAEFKFKFTKFLFQLEKREIFSSLIDNLPVTSSRT